MAHAVALLLVALAGYAAYRGWRAFWFLTDDAYIAFRYCSNAVLGHGLVWNPAPFRPVEGYTSFLWVALLALVWRATGIAPPEAANWLSLGFGLATLVLVERLVARMDLPPRLARHRTALLALVLLGIVTNRTYLAWLSSGLETALFNFCLVAWVYFATASRRDFDARTVLGLSASAACAALARPDGLLFFAASLALLAGRGLESRGDLPPRFWLAQTPLVAIPAHLLWRRSTYGEWLPNTYFAKHVAAWPESGVRYLASFAVEYGVWVWGLLLLAWLAASARALAASRSAPGARWFDALLDRAPLLVVLGALVAQFGYYTLIIGGDHFEYRVYSHLVPLLFVSSLWLAARVARRTWLVYALVGSFVLASWPIQWVHWDETRTFLPQRETHAIRHRISHRFPVWLRPLVRPFDDWQFWLISHYVCVRHREHELFLRHQIEAHPTRARGAWLRWEDRPVIFLKAVGVPGWVLPEVAVIDVFGLNDRVVARNPAPREPRMMAHERKPPSGYVECFRPNVRIDQGTLVVEPRVLTDDEIRRCEEHDWLGGGAGAPPAPAGSEIRPPPDFR